MEKMNFSYECKTKIIRRTIEELKENGINANIKRGHDIMPIYYDAFPDKIVSEYIDRSRVNLDIRSVFDKVANADLKYDESVINTKQMRKITAKAITKAVKKYIDKFSDGYEPKDDLEEDMNAYVAKKTVKYMDKAINKLEKKIMEDRQSIDDMETEDEDREI